MKAAINVARQGHHHLANLLIQLILPVWNPKIQHVRNLRKEEDSAKALWLSRASWRRIQTLDSAIHMQKQEEENSPSDARSSYDPHRADNPTRSTDFTLMAPSSKMSPEIEALKICVDVS